MLVPGHAQRAPTGDLATYDGMRLERLFQFGGLE